MLIDKFSFKDNGSRECYSAIQTSVLWISDMDTFYKIGVQNQCFVEPNILDFL